MRRAVHDVEVELLNVMNMRVNEFQDRCDQAPFNRTVNKLKPSNVRLVSTMRGKRQDHESCDATADSGVGESTKITTRVQNSGTSDMTSRQREQTAAIA